MKTTIVTAALILVLNTSASASNTRADKQLDTVETQNISLIDSLGRNSIERKQNASSLNLASLIDSAHRSNKNVPVKSINKHSTVSITNSFMSTLSMKTFAKSTKGRNIDMQSFALKQAAKAYDMHYVAMNISRGRN